MYRILSNLSVVAVLSGIVGPALVSVAANASWAGEGDDATMPAPMAQEQMRVAQARQSRNAGT